MSFPPVDDACVSHDHHTLVNHDVVQYGQNTGWMLPIVKGFRVVRPVLYKE